jgi:hypothetical protein
MLYKGKDSALGSRKLSFIRPGATTVVIGHISYD